jgi:hypothetical protein
MSINTVISFPIPAFQNVPIEPQFYQPSRFVIVDVALGQTTTVTTNINQNYVIGQEVRLLFPSKYGCGALNEKTGIVISIPTPNQVELNIYSVGVDPFIPSPIFLPFESKTPPQIVAIGDINTGLISSTGRTLPFGIVPTIPGSFENISP